MSALPNRKYTIEEYVELIKTTGEKMEYFDGEIFAMAGGKLAHGEIASNVQYALRRRLESRPCHTYNGEVAVKVPAAPPMRFPDVSVVCGEPLVEEFRGIDLLVNPLLIVEVLSDSTADYDLGRKFLAYQSIESFREYLAIAQKHVHVIQHSKQANGLWVRRDFIGLESEIYLEALDITITLNEIYQNVNFPETPTLP